MRLSPFGIMFQTNNPALGLKQAQTCGSKTLYRRVHDPVCDAAAAGEPGPTYQSALELLSIGAIDSALLSLSFYSCLFLSAGHPGAGLCSRANILAKVPVPKARVGCKFVYIRCMPIILSWTLLRV